MLKLFKRIQYAILSKTAERRINKKYGCHISIKVKEYEVRDIDGKNKSKIKTEITAYKKDCKKLITALLMKDGH